MYIYLVSIHTYITLFYHLQGLYTDIPGVWRTSTQTFVSNIIHPSLENWLILGLDHGIYKTSLAYLLVPRSKVVLGKKIKPALWRKLVKGTQRPTEGIPHVPSWKDCRNTTNKVVLLCKPKYKIDIQKSILI